MRAEHQTPADPGTDMADEQMAEYAQATADREAGRPTRRLDVAAYISTALFVALVITWVASSL